MNNRVLQVLVLLVCLTVTAYSQSGQTFNGNYQFQEGVNLEKWDFFSNGEFIHQGSMNFGDFGRTQRGTYRVLGPKLVLHIYSSSWSSAVHVPAGGRGAAAGQSNCRITHQSAIGFIGPSGSKGIVIDGRRFVTRSWDRGDKTSAPPPPLPPCENSASGPGAGLRAPSVSPRYTPPQAGGIYRPPQSGPIYTPRQTGTVYVPPQAGPGYTPPSTGPTYVPPQTGPAYKPPSTGPGYVPPQASSTYKGPTTGPGYAPPQNGGTYKAPSTGSGSKAPQTGPSYKSPTAGQSKGTTTNPSQ